MNDGSVICAVDRQDHRRRVRQPLLIFHRVCERLLGAFTDRQVLEVSADRSEVYVQGQLLVTMRLLSASDIRAYEFGKIPASQLDLVIEPLGDPRQYQTRIADRSYLVLEQQYAIFPQRSGPLEIPAINGEVRLPSRSSFDAFNTGGKIRRIQSQPLSIKVKPIPSGLGIDYWLPADRVELRERWPDDLDELVAGEPVTRSVVLIADGLTAAQLPEIELPGIDGIKQYPDQPVLRDTRSGDGIRAQRGQKVALIPAAAGTYRVPEFSIQWWNRASETLETVTLPARELVVKPASLSAVEMQPTPELPATTTTPVVAPAAPANRFWVWLSLFLDCGWAASLALWWYRARLRAQAFEPIDDRVSLRAAGRVLKQACERNDAAAVRTALLPWGRALMAPQPVANLNVLATLLGDEFRSEIEALNHSLYAADGHPWQGRTLWALCAARQPGPGRASSAGTEGLQPLNP